MSASSLPALLHHGAEGGEAAADHVVGHAVAQAEVAGAAEAVSGHHQQVVVQLGLLGERVGVAVGGLDEQVERAVGLGALVAHLPQAVVQQVAILIVGRQVGALTGAQLDDFLHQCGRADVTHDTGGTGNSGVHRGTVVGKARDVHIADALAGQGQGLGVGVADDGVAVQAGDKGHGDIAVHQLAVGLVGDNIDRVAVFGALALQQDGQTPQSLLGVHHTGGIVGGIDDDGLGMGRDALLHGVQMDLERLGIGGDHHQLAAVGSDEGTVLGEKRSHGHDLGITVQNESLDDGDQGRRRAAGEEQLTGLHIQAEAVGEVLGHGGAGILEAVGHGVAVEPDRVRGVHNSMDGLIDLFGGRDAGIAQGIVKDLIRAHLGGLLQTIGEQLTDDRRGGAQLIELLIDHKKTPFRR